MRILFKSVIANKADGWPMGFYGCSSIDNQDYALDTHYLKSDEVPEAMMDAKSSSELIAGLLNAYFCGVDVSGLDEEDVRKMGVYVEKPVPDPNQTQLPF